MPVVLIVLLFLVLVLSRESDVLPPFVVGALFSLSCTLIHLKGVETTGIVVIGEGAVRISADAHAVPKAIAGCSP